MLLLAAATSLPEVATTLTAVVLLDKGWLATETADALAAQSDLSPDFLGATLLALATSLPELSTTIAAVRNDRYSVAVSNVFGSNAFDVTLLVLAEVSYRGGSILEHARSSVVFVATLGAIMTCIYLWGLMERENRTVRGIGWDSAAAAVVYVGGMTVLYFLVREADSSGNMARFVSLLFCAFSRSIPKS